MLASASAAMLFATKETWIITAAVWLIAIPCTIFYLRLRKSAEDVPAWTSPATGENAARNTTKLYVKAAALFVAIGVLLYSSFFTNPRGILDSVLTFTYWTKTGQNGIYNRDWSTYYRLAWREEAPILMLGGSARWLRWSGRETISPFFAPSGRWEFSPPTLLCRTKRRGWC